MAVWSIVKVSGLYTSKRLGAEFYHPDKVNALRFLETRSRKTISDFFSNVRNILNPLTTSAHLVTPALLFDLSDVQAYFLGDGIPICNVAEIGSAKKVFKPSDVLISRLRPYLKEIAFVRHSKGVLLGSTEFIVLREKSKTSPPPEYLFVFLMTKQVQDVLLWSQEGTNHPRFPEGVLLDMPLPRPRKSVEARIVELVRNAGRCFTDSRKIYLQAERMVLKEIGWDELDLSQPKCWSAPLARARETNRLDAEHFQPKYDKLIAHLKNTGKAKPLGEIATHSGRGLQPQYVEGGEVVVVNSRHLGRYMLDLDATERTDEGFWGKNKRSRLRRHDVLLYSTGAYIGRTSAWLASRKAIASNHVTIIRPDDSCNPLYLAVFFNSPLGLLQTEKWASGSGQREIYPDDISRFLIYLPPKKFQQKVADLVQKSWNASRRAKAMLDDAKQMVEEILK